MNNNYFYKLASIADRIDWMRKEAVNWSNYINPILAGVKGLINPGSLIPTTMGVIGLPGWSGIGKDSQEPEVTNNTEPITIPSGPIYMDSTAFQNAFNASSVSQYPEDPIYTQTPPSPAWTDLQADMRTNSGQIPTQPADVSTVVPEQSVAPQQAPQSPIKSKQQQLVDRWVAEKYQQFKNNPNYQVSRETMKMFQNAADRMVKKNPNIDPSAAEYDFNSAVQNHQNYRNKQLAANNKAKNPVATSAVPNPSQYANSYEDAVRYSDMWVREHGWNPDSLSNNQRAYRKAMNDYLSKLYPSAPGNTSYTQFLQESINRGSSPFGGAQQFVGNVTDRNTDKQHFAEYGPISYNSKKQVVRNLMDTTPSEPDGTYKYPQGTKAPVIKGTFNSTTPATTTPTTNS